MMRKEAIDIYCKTLLLTVIMANVCLLEPQREFRSLAGNQTENSITSIQHGAFWVT